MAINENYTVRFRRKGKTNYQKRRRLISFDGIRVVIRAGSKRIIIHGSEFNDKGDKTLYFTNSSELKKFGWNHNLGNMASSYLSGFLFGSKAREKHSEVIIDTGNQILVKKSRIYAAIKGMNDAELNVRCSKGVLPAEDKINGKNYADFNEVKEKIGKVISETENGRREKIKN